MISALVNGVEYFFESVEFKTLLIIGILFKYLCTFENQEQNVSTSELRIIYLIWRIHPKLDRKHFFTKSNIGNYNKTAIWRYNSYPSTKAWLHSLMHCSHITQSTSSGSLTDLKAIKLLSYFWPNKLLGKNQLIRFYFSSSPLSESAKRRGCSTRWP